MPKPLYSLDSIQDSFVQNISQSEGEGKFLNNISNCQSIGSFDSEKIGPHFHQNSSQYQS